MNICSIASGSKGNCLYLESGDTRLLIDAGLSLRETVKRLESNGIDPSRIDAVLVTHEHMDHIRSAGSFSRKFRVPVFTAHQVHHTAAHSRGKPLDKARVVEFEPGGSFTFRDLAIDPFPVTHDAVSGGTVGFVVESREGRFGTATDLGLVTRLVTDKLRGCRALNLESNHDMDMLMNGPYPWDLKQRIKGRHGHLSNEESLALLHDLAHDGLELLVMAHLSEVNNHPDHVVRSTESFLRGQNICAPRIVIGDQFRASAVMVLGE